MNWFINIKQLYDWEVYTDEDIQQFVVWNKITQEQADIITGKISTE